MSERPQTPENPEHTVLTVPTSSTDSSSGGGGGGVDPSNREQTQAMSTPPSALKKRAEEGEDETAAAEMEEGESSSQVNLAMTISGEGEDGGDEGILNKKRKPRVSLVNVPDPARSSPQPHLPPRKGGRGDSVASVYSNRSRGTSFASNQYSNNTLFGSASAMNMMLSASMVHATGTSYEMEPNEDPGALDDLCSHANVNPEDLIKRLSEMQQAQTLAQEEHLENSAAGGGFVEQMSPEELARRSGVPADALTRIPQGGAPVAVALDMEGVERSMMITASDALVSPNLSTSPTTNNSSSAHQFPVLGSTSSASLAAGGGGGGMVGSRQTFMSNTSSASTASSVVVRDGSFSRSSSSPVFRHERGTRRSRNSSAGMMSRGEAGELGDQFHRFGSRGGGGGSSSADAGSTDQAFLSSNHHTTSTNSASRRSQASLGTNASSVKRKVMFNDIEDVVVFEIEEQVFIDIHYRRNKAGWFFLFLAVCADVGCACHLTYFVTVEHLSYSVVSFWAAVYKVLYFVLFMVLGLTANLISWRNFSDHVFNKQVMKWTWPWAFLLSLALTMQLALGHLEIVTFEKPAQYYPTVNLFLVWIFLWRRFKKEPVFFQEVIGGIIAFIGFPIACWKSYGVFEEIDLVWINLWLLGLSIIVTMWWFFTEKVVKYSPSFGLTVLSCTITDLIGSIILVAALGHTDLLLKEASDPSYGLLVGIELFLVDIMYLVSATYLDILSLAAGFAMKAVLLPFLQHFVVYNTLISHKKDQLSLLNTTSHDGLVQMELLSAEVRAYEDMADTQWNFYLWLGMPVVLLGCLIIVVFASVKRQFVARRLAWKTPMRRPSDPYSKKAAARNDTSKQHQDKKAGGRALVANSSTTSDYSRRVSRPGGGSSASRPQRGGRSDSDAANRLKLSSGF